MTHENIMIRVPKSRKLDKSIWDQKDYKCEPWPLLKEIYHTFHCIFSLLHVFQKFEGGSKSMSYSLWMQFIPTVHQMGLCQWKNDTNCIVSGLNLPFPWMTLLLTGLNDNPVVLIFISHTIDFKHCKWPDQDDTGLLYSYLRTVWCSKQTLIAVIICRLGVFKEGGGGRYSL